MFATAFAESLAAVGIFFLCLYLCAEREFSLEKSLAVSGLWTGVFLICWH